MKPSTILGTGTLVLFAAGLLVPASTLKAAEIPDSEHVSKLISQAKTLAFQLKEDAVLMEGFNRMTVSRESQLAAIRTLKADINALGELNPQLKAAEGEGAPWQRAVIDRIAPYLEEMIGYTTAEIEYLTTGEHNPAQYKDYLEANADYASDLAAMIGDFVSYGNAKHRVEHLTEKLEIPEK